MASLAVTSPSNSSFFPFAEALSNLHIKQAPAKVDHSDHVNAAMIKAVNARTSRVGLVLVGSVYRSRYDAVLNGELPGSPLAQCQELIVKLERTIKSTLKQPNSSIVFAQLANFQRLMVRSESLFYRRQFETLSLRAGVVQKMYFRKELSFKRESMKRERMAPSYANVYSAIRALNALFPTSNDVIFSAEQQLLEASSAVSAAEDAINALWHELHS
jgi:hypothetical protein